MKYRAFIDFTHNGVKIKGGEVFDNNVIKFSLEDINFLKEQNKIELILISEKPKQESNNLKNETELEDEFIEPDVVETEVDLKSDAVNEEEVLTEDSSTQDNLDEIEEEIEEEEVKSEIEEILPWEKSDDEITVDIKESRLTRLNKPVLIELAEKLSIETEGKTKKELAIEIAKINE